MNAQQAANVERWAMEDALKVDDSAWRAYCANLAAEEAAAKEGPCALCRQARRQWTDLCDDCADVFQDLAHALEDAGQLELEDAGPLDALSLDAVGLLLEAGWDAAGTCVEDVDRAIRHHADAFTPRELATLSQMVTHQRARA